MSHPESQRCHAAAAAAGVCWGSGYIGGSYGGEGAGSGCGG